MPKLKVMRAQPGRMVRGRFVPGKARNIAQGFHDSKGVFHPIRASSDYDSRRVSVESKRPARKKKAKPAPKKKSAPKKKKAAARKKPAAKKRAKR